MRGYPDVVFLYTDDFQKRMVAEEPDNIKLRRTLENGNYLGHVFARWHQMAAVGKLDAGVIRRRSGLFEEYRRITAKPYNPEYAIKLPKRTPWGECRRYVQLARSRRGE